MIQNPVRAVLHGVAAIVSIFGSLLLVQKEGNGALVVYGAALVGMYSTSTLYHAVPWSPSWKSRMQRLDHTFIYLLVVGTFTALAVGVLAGLWLWSALFLLWALAAVGVGREFLAAFRRRWSLTVQLGLGALALIPVFYLFREIDGSVQLLTIVGGVVYLGGLAMFVNRWPRMFPRVFGFHELFHVLVIVASIAHFSAVWQVWVSTA